MAPVGSPCDADGAVFEEDVGAMGPHEDALLDRQLQLAGHALLARWRVEVLQVRLSHLAGAVPVDVHVAEERRDERHRALLRLGHGGLISCLVQRGQVTQFMFQHGTPRCWVAPAGAGGRPRVPGADAEPESGLSAAPVQPGSERGLADALDAAWNRGMVLVYVGMVV